MKSTSADEADRRSTDINLRCVGGVDLASIPVLAFDGKSL